MSWDAPWGDSTNSTRAGSADRSRCGTLDGYDGLIDGHFRELTRVLSDGAVSVDIEVDAAGGQGGTIIGSAQGDEASSAT